MPARSLTNPNASILTHRLFCVVIAVTAAGGVRYAEPNLGMVALAIAVASLTLVSPGLAPTSALASRVPSRRRPTYHQFVRRRLGTPAHPLQFARRFLIDPLTAATFRGFWAAWNPPFAYVLGYFVYTPLRTRLPRRTAWLLTFLASGLLLHDVPFNFTADIAAGKLPVPTTTALFAIFGLLTLVSEPLGVDLRRRSPFVRALANVAWLASGFLVRRLLNIG
jgi:hypothetical protein